MGHFKIQKHAVHNHQQDEQGDKTQKPLGHLKQFMWSRPDTVLKQD